LQTDFPQNFEMPNLSQEYPANMLMGLPPQGVVGAFAITRALAMLPVDPACTPMPLTCGSPLGYVSPRFFSTATIPYFNAALHPNTPTTTTTTAAAAVSGGGSSIDNGGIFKRKLWKF
jgi:hypothetical protein